MSRAFGYHGLGLLAVCATVFVLGCGAGTKGVRVEGKLAKGGQPWVPEQGQTLSLSLTGKGPKGDDVVYPASVNSGDGTFVFAGPGGGGVPPGKYKIAANLAGSMGNDPAALAKLSGLNKQVAAVNGLEYVVTETPVQTITVDVATGSITRH